MASGTTGPFCPEMDVNEWVLEAYEGKPEDGKTIPLSLLTPPAPRIPTTCFELRGQAESAAYIISLQWLGNSLFQDS